MFLEKIAPLEIVKSQSPRPTIGILVEEESVEEAQVARTMVPDLEAVPIVVAETMVPDLEADPNLTERVLNFSFSPSFTFNLVDEHLIINC